MICTNCKKNEAIHEENDSKAFCRDCMDDIGIAWDRDNSEFVPMYASCSCGDYMTWCTICCMYTQTCCVDYGTCMCS